MIVEYSALTVFFFYFLSGSRNTVEEAVKGTLGLENREIDHGILSFGHGILITIKNSQLLTWMKERLLGS